MRKLHALRYVALRGLRGMAQAPLVQLLAVATIGVCMLLLSAVLLAWQNARSITDQWGIDIPVSAYLVDDISSERTAHLAERIAQLPRVERVDIVTPELAMTRLVEGLGNDPSLLVGIEPGVLPTSLEVYLPPHEAASAQPLLDLLETEPDIEEVVAAGTWVGRAEALLQTLRISAMVAASLVGFACLTIVWSTIRLAVYARRAEIHILRLVGGTASFVHGPFVVEGLLQGVMGAALALGLLYVSFDALEPLLADAFSLAFAASGLRFLTPLECAMLIGFAAALGVLGSRAAVSRHVEA